MAKGKSSASSATRKKHARKAAVAHGEVPELPQPKEKKSKGEKKGKKNKEAEEEDIYTSCEARTCTARSFGHPWNCPEDPCRAPGRPQAPCEERLGHEEESFGRSSSKLGGKGEEGGRPRAVERINRSSARLASPSACSVPSSIAPHTITRDQFVFFLHEVADADQAENIVGAWCMAVHDVDRQVAAFARESWDRFITVLPSESEQSGKVRLRVGSTAFSSLWDFTQRVLLDPAGIYTYLNPPQPVILTPGKQVGKGASSRVRREDEPPSRSGREEEEESEGDRKARLRISGFGVAEWVLSKFTQFNEDAKKVDEFVSPLDNLALWSSLYHTQFAPFVQDEIEAFGYNQPGVRKAAWGFAQVLLRTCKASLTPLLSTLSHAMLRSAWIEPDAGVRQVLWQPLLTFLKEYPNAWELEAASPAEADGDNESDEEGEEEGQNSETLKPSASESKVLVSHAYEEFRQFLELGCMGSPVQEYPAVIIILSTIPSSIMASIPTPIQTLFTSFWAAVDGRALSGLDRTTASAAFLSSLLECTRFIARRLLGENGAVLLGADASISQRDGARELVQEQTKRAWEELCSGRLKVEDEVAADSLAKFFKDLAIGDEDLFDSAWTTFADAVRAQTQTPASIVPTLVSVTLKSCNKIFDPSSHPSKVAKVLTSDVVRTTIERFEGILETDESIEVNSTILDSLVSVLNEFGEDLFSIPELAAAIDNTCLHHVRRLLAISPAALQVYLSYRADEEPCSLLWEAVLRELAHSSEDLLQLLPPLLDAAEGNKLPGYLRPSSSEIDDVTGQLLVTALNGHSSQSLSLVKRLLAAADHFISQECFQGLISSLTAAFSQHVRDTLRGEQFDARPFNALLSLLEVAFQKQALSASDSLGLLPDAFTFAFILPLLDDIKLESSQLESARMMWHAGLSQVSEELREDIFVHVKQSLRDIVPDCGVALRPSRLVRMLTDPSLELPINVMEDILPRQEQLDGMLEELPTSPTEVCLAVIDPLVLPGDFSEVEHPAPSAYDYAGFATYSRVVDALMSYFLDDRQAARENVWALRHFIALAIWAKDLLNVQASQSPVFSQRVSKAELENIALKAQQLASYLLAPASEEGWSQRVVRSLLQAKPQVPADGVEALLHTLVRPKSDSMRESRILHIVLQHVLAGASKSDADDFIQLARSLEKKDQHASLAIALSVTQYAPEPPKLERYRNELAAGIFGVPASKANTEGLWLLRQFVATAPDSDSDVVYLPVPRAVNLMKACQQWITSDEELDEEVEAEMTSVFIHLAPILQNVPGSHWDLIFDVMENNLESASFDEADTLPVLARTLKLLITVQDLVTTNKALRAVWDERKVVNLTLVRDLVAKRLESTSGNVPLSICRELGLTIVQDLPSTLLDKDSLSKMCHILTDPSDTVQRMAYKMLRESAAKYTEHLVLEAAVDSDAELKLELPLELISLLQMNLPEDDLEGDAANQNIFGYLLIWMLAFDLFNNASLRVKSGYLDHLRGTNLIADRFLPLIFSTLNLYDGILKAVKLDIWAVDEYYLDLYAPDVPASLSLLAAHLYYRSLHLVPVLIRNWLLDCRDRQLSSAVTTYTSTYFSPALLQAELARVKEPDATSQLTDENMKVKVASAVNEVIAVYTVDDQELEVRLKLPSDWPLHTIEIKEGSRVGVTEDRWRSWILGMQQILTFRSGSITDGVVFFLKNVASHFEGQPECAICYSIISAMDGSLPKKPCKTCKNRFHAACLYKWFNSSHSSSCPLCRSEIIQ
ncbi:hypothetical protein NM688_g3725 [Phlebia brevispora]|uniref:Uncharacterized protein n=1 Tax=Phlebia brevispora TaxID=194682 RepID=A0ACC1T520_9APHY|nr:hypothetical protein NM688_g3725 [Phlebia brevispora]